MNYYKVTTKGAHAGSGTYRPLTFYIQSTSMIKAMDFAKQMPGVKHHSNSVILSAKEITFEEYKNGRQVSAYSEYQK